MSIDTLTYTLAAVVLVDAVYRLRIRPRVRARLGLPAMAGWGPLVPPLV